MRCETIPITVPGADGPASLAAYLPDNLPELGRDRRRPAVIVCPGGGYHRLSDREGEPVALRFLGLGCAAFVLYYHVAPQGRWPVPQRQLLAAIDHVRTHAGGYFVDPDAIIVMGFSAGGHLGGLRRDPVEPGGAIPPPSEGAGGIPPRRGGVRLSRDHQRSHVPPPLHPAAAGGPV